MPDNEDFKREAWQFFTITNPFFVSAFYERFSLIPAEDKRVLLEPFAWANNIISLIEELESISNYEHSWDCFDIDISHENVNPEYEIKQQDTIKNYPKWYWVAITNPPYLAKNSATRRWLIYEYPEYEDLYQKCLEVMLDNTKFVAAIIPESFINSWLFVDRLYSFVSLTCKMFDDTDCPDCLALFVPCEVKQKDMSLDDFYLYRMDKKIWNYSLINSIIDELFSNQEQVNWTFNDKEWDVWIVCIDNTKRPSIEFIKWDTINPNNIKVSSRSLTRVSWLPSNINLELFLEECNKILNEYRIVSNDVCLTSFKWLRDDLCYRRRLDFKTAKMIMNTACFNIKNKQWLL